METEQDRTARALALIEKLCGPSDARADRAVEVIHAQAAALGWVHATTGGYPAPFPVQERLQSVAWALREDDRDPVTTLQQVAEEALAAHYAAAA
jgi:hypothetical protein